MTYNSSESPSLREGEERIELPGGWSFQRCYEWPTDHYVLITPQGAKQTRGFAASDARTFAAALRSAAPAVSAELACPVAWMRGVFQPSSPDGPAECDAEFAYGDDQPEGGGWMPLYRDSVIAKIAGLAGLAALLGKFVPSYETWMDSWSDDVLLSIHRTGQTFGDLRRARKALDALTAGTKPEEPGEPVTLTYTNWKGETAERTITPTGRVLFTSNEWHPEPQWLVEAQDARSGEVRLFALKGLGAPTCDGAAVDLAEVERLKSALVEAVRRDCDPCRDLDRGDQPYETEPAERALMSAIRSAIAARPSGGVPTADVSVVGPVNGLNEIDPQGSYFRLVTWSAHNTDRRQFRMSRGALEVLCAEINGVLAAAPKPPTDEPARSAVREAAQPIVWRRRGKHRWFYRESAPSLQSETGWLPLYDEHALKPASGPDRVEDGNA